ncbi:hypothetical protein TVAG_091020 [Trichomonas vaginalis G3]|uniref:Uncharacterized protein n=2 Tax=Trichomonas vaginalis (strain ATCC PRA-98 / G3) TaxID=412133 RepID=A2F606_TRIV3|nr:hypothetical protein TVAG_091020 [Trichomonas vaginalis G3]|eukprot:XP_001312565.1 hypothetical protein [Trichomonas vaginalis G3]
MIEYQIANKQESFNEFLNEITNAIYETEVSNIDIMSYISEAIFTNISGYVQIPNNFTQSSIAILFRAIGRYIPIENYREYLIFVLTHNPHPFHVNCFIGFPQLLPCDELVQYISSVEGEDKEITYNNAFNLILSLSYEKDADSMIEKALSVLSIDQLKELSMLPNNLIAYNALLVIQMLIRYKKEITSQFIDTIYQIFGNSLNPKILLLTFRILSSICETFPEEKQNIMINICQILRETPEHISAPIIAAIEGNVEHNQQFITFAKFSNELSLWRNENTQTNPEFLRSIANAHKDAN